MKKFFWFFPFATICFIQCAYALTNMPEIWAKLQPVLEERLTQKQLKMKLYKSDIDVLVHFLNSLTDSPKNLVHLQNILPKTTIELLRSVAERGVVLAQAEKIADYLDKLVNACKFQNTPAFDENTSHIIGRQWHEIDYSGEKMTWRTQQQWYAPYGVIDFRTLESVQKFFSVESTLPYFNRIYKPENPNALKGYFETITF